MGSEVRSKPAFWTETAFELRHLTVKSRLMNHANVSQSGVRRGENWVAGPLGVGCLYCGQGRCRCSHPEQHTCGWRCWMDGATSSSAETCPSRHNSTSESREHRTVQAVRGKVPVALEVKDMDDFSLELRGVRGVSHSTMSNYQGSVRLFMEYLTDSSYGWAPECLKRFGTHPAQIAFEWNTARHREDSMGGPKKRPYTREELQVLFDCADDHVVAAQLCRLQRLGGLVQARNDDENCLCMGPETQ